MEKEEIMRRPAIRSGIGCWNYYVSSMTFKQVADFVKMPDEIYTSKKLSDMMQRSITDNVNELVKYIKNEKEHFFNALILAVYDGSPQWYEGVFEYEDEEFYNIGVLEFNKESGVKIFPVDGQHRVAAIKKIDEEELEKNPEEIPVIFIAHINDKEGIMRTRRLFTTLNRYAKPVKLNEIIALDEDDIVAIVTRELIEDGSVFSESNIAFSKTESTKDTDQDTFTNIITLYKCNDYLLKAFFIDNDIKTKDAEYKRYRKSNDEINAFQKYCEDFWQLLISANSEIKEYFDCLNEKNITIRSKSGGNMLFRPAGLKAYVEAIKDIHIKTELSFKTIFFTMNDIDFSLNSYPWKKSLWNESDGSMIMNNKKLINTMLIYLFNCRNHERAIKINEDNMIKSYASLLNYQDAKDEEIRSIIEQKS